MMQVLTGQYIGYYICQPGEIWYANRIVIIVASRQTDLVNALSFHLSGYCICDEGFESEDCSVNISKPPDVTAIPLNGLCDIQKRPCLATAVIGFQFVANSELTCQMNRLQVNLYYGDKLK